MKQVLPFDLSQSCLVVVPMDLDPALVDVVGSPLPTPSSNLVPMRPSAWKLRFVVEVVWNVDLQVDVQEAHGCLATASKIPLRYAKLWAFDVHVPQVLDQNPPCRSCTCPETVATLECET